MDKEPGRVKHVISGASEGVPWLGGEGEQQRSQSSIDEETKRRQAKLFRGKEEGGSSTGWQAGGSKQTNE